MSTLKYNTWLNTDNTENYKCRAWVNFNGTGTVAIRASGNVSSITDNGTGNYSVNFTNSIADANYSINVSTHRDGTGTGTLTSISNTQTTTTNQIVTRTTGDSNVDCDFVCVSVFR